MKAYILASLLLVASCAVSKAPMQLKENSDLTLDNKTFNGCVRASGIVGLICVDGVLSFKNGQLYWTVDDSVDKANFQLTPAEDFVSFSASYTIENNESVEWSGKYNGTIVYDVKALWTRQPGDWVHDMFLPDVVTMMFKPKD